MPLEWFLEKYEIRPSGEVLSLSSGKLLKPCLKKTGYMQVVLKRDGKSKTCLLHRLIALTHCANPDNLPDVNHIDLDKQNNDSSNLEWVTKKQNNQRRSSNKIQEGDEVEIRVMYESGNYTQKELAEMFKVHQAHISRVVRFERR